jgi:hypothetical protein
MKKINVLIIISFFTFLIFFSGCINENNEDGKELYINFFNVNPSIIIKGETANLSWNVSGASSVNINMGIGNVGLFGSRIILPNKNTTYVLTASNLNHSINASVYIIVESQDFDDETDFNNPPNDLTISGENNGYINTSYLFDIISFDPDNDLIKYHIDWDDGESYSSDYMESGFIYKISHKWINEGIYEIKVYAEDKTNIITETKKHIITISDNNTEQPDDDTPSIVLSKSDGSKSNEGKIRVNSISADNVLWDDIEISLVNISAGLTREINYVPQMSLVDDYISVGDIIMLYELTESDYYQIILNYIPSSGIMGSVSWTQ